MEKYNFLVTGGAGFIGSNMVDFLIKEGHNVTIIDNLSTGKLSNVNLNAKFIKLDINSEEFSFDDFDYVIHMAAIPNVQQSIDDPLISHQNNFQTTLKILSGCINTNVKKIVFSSTSAIYGNPKKFPTNEELESNPMSPYALDKLSSENYLKLYSELYGIKSVCLRYFNVFGERMTNEGAYKSVISVFKEQKENNTPLTITNDGNQRRDFIYVKDVVVANYLSCINDTGNFNLFNVGYGENISVNEIASYFNHPSSYIGHRIEPFETICDNTKIKTSLGWYPTISVKEWLNINLNKKYNND
jgi:UDP-glucose 4-epimerase